MAFYLGKFFELAGIGTVSIALLVGVSEENAMGRELTLLMIGAALFLTGRLIEARGANKS